MTEMASSGIACGSCGMVLPPEWMGEPRDQRSPCPKCRGTQRRTAIPKSAPKPDPASSRGRGRLIAASLVLSAAGVGLLAWWLLSDPRSWIVLGAGVVAAFSGAAIGARSRRTLPP